MRGSATWGKLALPAVLVGFGALLALAPAAQGKAQLIETSESARELGVVKKAKCRVKRRGGGKVFYLDGKTTNGNYKLSIDILDFRGFDERYNIEFGKIKTTVDIEGVRNGSDYSTAYPFPGGQPPNSAGAMEFSPRGSRLAIGTYGVPSKDYEEGVAVAGAIRCKYGRRN